MKFSESDRLNLHSFKVANCDMVLQMIDDMVLQMEDMQYLYTI